MTQHFVGTAGWSISHNSGVALPESGTGLTKYASLFGATEINSTFYRRHRASTFERWRASVPEGFRFSVKLPRSITHEAGLASPGEALREFFDDVRPLGDKLGPILVQLPASADFELRCVRAFFRILRGLHGGCVACEPRNPSWYTQAATRVFCDYDIARVVADPPRPADAHELAGVMSLRYFRWHGSPVIYRSSYDDGRLESIAARIAQERGAGSVWCIFDNTASGAAASDALRTVSLLR